MSEQSPPDTFEGDVRPAPQSLRPESIDTILEDFRTWLQQVGTTATDLTPAEGPSDSKPDLFTLLTQFTALRQEINLQTRATRSQQEQNAATLQELARALDVLQKAASQLAGGQQAEQEDLLRPLLKTLVDVYDALALARREVQRVKSALLDEIDQLKQAAREFPPEGQVVPFVRPHLSLWARLFGGDRALDKALAEWREDQQVLEEQYLDQALQTRQLFQTKVEQSADRVKQILDSLATGYTMSVQRIDRALQQYDLEPIPAVGEPFDPETMEVLEVVSEPGRTSTEVIEEVRRGYLWRERLFRFAQVRVAKPAPEERNEG